MTIDEQQEIFQLPCHYVQNSSTKSRQGSAQLYTYKPEQGSVCLHQLQRIGVHHTESGYAFIEVETHFSYTMDSARSKSGGGTAALAPQPAYPVSVAGNVYRFGYKHEL